MASDSSDIIALLESMPWETRNDPSTCRKIAEAIAEKARAKMAGSTEFQSHSAELNEQMFKPQRDQQAQPQQAPQDEAAAPAGVEALL